MSQFRMISWCLNTVDNTKQNVFWGYVHLRYSYGRISMETRHVDSLFMGIHVTLERFGPCFPEFICLS